jgi:hypothetical protein
MNGAKVGAPLTGAELIIVSGANANTRVTSDASGHYAFDALESGRFTVSIGAPGYVTATPVVDLYRDIEANFALSAR